MNSVPDDHPAVREFEERMSALPKAIMQDFARSLEIYESNPDDPFSRRLLVRAVVSYVEGQMAAIRERLLFYYHFLTNPEMQDVVPESIELAEKLNLSFRVKDYFALAGKSLRQMKRANTISDEVLCVEETIKLLFRLHGQVYAHSITPTGEADGWQMLMEVKQKRNQLTHPKCAADLEVTNEQARKALVVFVWMRSYLDGIHEIENAKWKVLCDEVFKGEL